jgi:hypothetical protein
MGAALAVRSPDRHRHLIPTTALTSSHRFSESTASGAVARRYAPVPLASATPSVGATLAPVPRAHRPAPPCFLRDGRTPPDTIVPRPRTSLRGRAACRPVPRCSPLPPSPASALPRPHWVRRQMLARALAGRSAGRRPCVPEPAARCAGPNFDGSSCRSCRSLRLRHPEPQLGP